MVKVSRGTSRHLASWLTLPAVNALIHKDWKELTSPSSSAAALTRQDTTTEEPSQRLKHKLHTGYRQVVQAKGSCKRHSVPSSSRIQKAVMVFLNSQLLSLVRKLLANSHWYFTFIPIKIPTRVIWWRLAALQHDSKDRKQWFKCLYLGKYPQYISYEFPLGRHFCLPKASAPRWHRVLYPSAEPVTWWCTQREAARL